ncbi:MAG: hypothetical protein LRZ84_13550 [Desertifilum sp.]|nr:hypothetical protein [Desertifilum sp.]
MTASGKFFQHYVSINDRASVWPPKQSNLQVGDYGTYKHGIFTKFGNIKQDYGVRFDVSVPQHLSNVHLEIGKISKQAYSLSGNAKVPIPEVPAEAEGEFAIEYTFHDSLSFIYYADRVSYQAMGNPQEVARELSAKIDREKNWDFHRYRPG